MGDRKIGDKILPFLYNPPDVQDVPGYEEALVTSLNEHVKSGDAITVVGVGLGVTCVVAAKAAGPNGRVKCFEGDLQGCLALTRLAGINGVDDRIQVVHAVVGDNIAVYGTDVAARTIKPQDLPDCDVLELDCEGSEIGILRDMKINPRVITVETHGIYGSPTDLVRKALEARGYEVEDRGWAEPRYKEICSEKDIKVLVGVRRSH